ncbi:MAG: pyridoxine 5'-phosphate synthase [Alphaproteobacteria bacterium TMED89]|nr:pyridoxine 5'-phosphate synthase [Rhodospirillaceae bacterium]RPH17079.1 MAG: pyridoxine 5'-phosphate synthase [Alphaproteobacteria bacterium TMED89]
MTLLSVNINKIALLRNSRGTGTPDLVQGAQLAIAGGAQGITVHPREDQRHITLDDVIAVADLPEIKSGQVEFNVEGDMREDLFNMVRVLKPTQFTVVPVMAGEVTSSRGWRAYDDHDHLEYWAAEMREVGIRTAVFVDPEPTSVELAAACTIEAVEIYTGDYAAAFERGDHAAALDAIERTANTARALSLRLNGGHDLTVDNLGPLCARVQFDEFSIGHHIASDALFRGFSGAVADFKSAVPEGV